MPGIARKGSDTAGGTQLGGGQDWVKIDGDAIVLLGDPVAAHGPPPHRSPVMAQGSSWVKIGNVPICRAGDAASCGHASTGSDWVASS